MSAVHIYDVFVHNWRHFITSAGVMWLAVRGGHIYLITADNQTKYRARLPDRHVISVINASSEIDNWRDWNDLVALGLLAPN